MRAGLIGFAGLLTTGIGAVAQTAPPAAAGPSVEEMAALADRRSAEAAARQAAFDRLIGERGSRAIRSVCDGCANTAGRRAPRSPQIRMRSGADHELAREPGFDPAQAPVD